MVTLATEDYMVRVQAGKKVETRMIKFLRKVLRLIVEIPTAAEDMKDKIDCFIVANGKRFPTQLKYREDGSDIIMEVVKDLDKNIPGRDMQGVAELYFLMDNQDRGWLFKYRILKDKAKEIATTVLSDLKQEPARTNWSGEGWQAKVTVDRRHGNRKLMVFLDKESFPHDGPWDIPF